MPKRTIGLKDQRGNLTGISAAKYPELIADIWEALAKPVNASRNLTFTVSRNKYRSRINPDLTEVIDRHVDALNQDSLHALGQQLKITVREMRSRFENDPDRYRELIGTALRNGLVRTAVAPLLIKLQSSFERQGADSFEKAYDIEDELGSRLVADAEEPLSSGVATAIVDNRFDELDSILDDILDVETIRRRLKTYFETFHTGTFFDELHELRSTLKLRENFETYLYLCTLQHNHVSYPLFYIPIGVSLDLGLFRLTADPQIYVNKKAIEYAAQEMAREISRPIPIAIKDRIIYLHENESFSTEMQDLLDRWCADLTLKPPIDLSNPIDQRAQRSQLTITNSIHFAAFDKSDESLLNDYEELMTLLESDSEMAGDFRKIVSSFLTKDPLDVTADVDREWSGMPIEHRLIFQSPVPLNEEQRKILMAIRHRDSRFISIEGPPGTGKSHTITAIVFEAILNGQNVLVLSDKTEALDVVEDKLTEVLNSVRFDKNFENPILRLGRSSNSYGRILGGASIQAIKAHLRATPPEARLLNHIRQDETELSKNIQNAAAYGSNILLRDVYDLQQQERHIDKMLGTSEDLGADDVALDALDAAIGISGLLSGNGGGVLKILRAIFRRTTLATLQEFLKIQKAFSVVDVPPEADVQAMRLFSAFHQKHIAELQKIIISYQKARWPVFGYLFCRARALELDGHLGKSLFIVDSLNAHRRVFQLEFAYRAFSKFSSALTRAGIQESHHCIVFQQVIDGLAPQVKDIDLNLSRIGQIRIALSERPYLKSKLGLDSDNIEDWTALSTSIAAVKLRDAFSYATHYRRLREAFRSIPKFDYVGDKVKLESLQAQRLANKLDKEVIDFSDNNRNLALSIRDIIRKRQRFPRESFEALRKAFPCMIASIRDFAEYVPLEKDLFDIVVIDEASQVSIAQAFPAFIRAKKLVVLGDRKQFSNVKTATASTATNNVYANAIMNDFGRENALDDNTVNRLRLFNIKTSVLEFVERIANAQTMLKKHFRSYPELISFSSQNFYSGQLQAVKIRGEAIEDVIRFTAVDHDGRIETRKNTNAIEYDAILKELRRLAEFDPAPSVGIITPFTEQQSLFVQKIASDPDSDLFQDKLRLKIMTFDSCQGDERDVIIYSMVATPEVDKLSYIFPKSLSEADEVDHQLRQQRLNVGFSRAKERIHFFHSQPFEAFRGAIGQAIAHYRNQLTIGHKRPGADTTDPKSPMEARVRNWLLQTHFVQKLGELVEINPQFELGRYLRQIDPTYKHPAYRVDFLIRVHSPQGTINIVLEYDGFKEHFTNLDKVDATNYAEYYRPEDVERQKVLEGYGYHFLRINRFNLGKDPARSLDERLLKLAGDALKEVESHVVVDEAKEVAAGILNGEKKLCETCGVVRDISDFKDSSTKSGMSRKCRYCKEQDKKGTKRRRNRRRW